MNDSTSIPELPLSSGATPNAPLHSEYHAPEFTTVNGNGLWNSWTRNFKTPLLALLDLVDNALDAALLTDFHNGRVHVQRADSGEYYLDENGHRDVFGDRNDEMSGLCLTNNSYKPIRPLSKVLEVYNSTKGKGKDSIGENGVGLKQGCATLSDLSFVMTRNDDIMELGVIAASLQRDEGCRLPSFRMSISGVAPSDLSSVISEEIEAIADCDEGVMACIKHYGKGVLEAGINKLTRNLVGLTDHTWGIYGFRVILVDLRHGNGLSNKTLRSQDKATTLMQMLASELPQTYIHIPHKFDFIVDEKKVVFNFWQRRLVELSKFEVKVDTNRSFLSYEKGDDTWKNPEGAYTIKLYLGFDPIRLRNEFAGSHCALYVYSRQSGRLIKHLPDGRALLGLNSGGSDFSQGLTVLVDDEDGHLPLNPTKQDISFGEQENGGTHETNLYAWMNAVTNFYWKLHADKFGGKKAPLTDEVLKHLDDVLSEQDRRYKNLLKDDDLTTYYDIAWGNYRGHIMVHKKSSLRYKEHVGAATRFRIDIPMTVAKKQRTPRRSGEQVQRDIQHLEERVDFETESRRTLEKVNSELLESLSKEQAEKKQLKKRIKFMQIEMDQLRQQLEAANGSNHRDHGDGAVPTHNGLKNHYVVSADPQLSSTPPPESMRNGQSYMVDLSQSQEAARKSSKKKRKSDQLDNGQRFGSLYTV